MKRGDIYWADLGPPVGRRPVLILSRSIIIPGRRNVVVALVTTNIRDLDSEVPLGPHEGLRRASVANCDNLLTVPKASLGDRRAGGLGTSRIPALDKALRYALDIRY